MLMLGRTTCERMGVVHRGKRFQVEEAWWYLLSVSPLHLIELVAVCGVVGPGDSLPREKWMKPDGENV
ncbi:hypothetical protein Pmani_013112 [Petrolisthes manimaculis]|uniref:Uncharacterized protein n=1 Tax=Petrolisthes manimaculis TaxID=1843537 RepID=A0AAE1PWF8_9EUCA|nr:hypothetical protein Pmani_013112 [Petrolisthes manimaculis]